MLRLRTLLASALTLALLATPLSAEKARKPTPPLTAQEYPMHDEHELEHVAIAAEPGDTRETRPDTRLDYFANDLLPIRVIVTNDSEFDLTLDDARIHLISADNATIPAATDDELQRRMFTLKSANKKDSPPAYPSHPSPFTATSTKRSLRTWKTSASKPPPSKPTPPSPATSSTTSRASANPTTIHPPSTTPPLSSARSASPPTTKPSTASRFRCNRQRQVRQSIEPDHTHRYAR